MKIKMISPTGNIYEMNYYEVYDFCQMLCNKKENIDRFNEFKKDYNYFEAYFDFVIFELGYMMKNAIFEGKCIFNYQDEIFIYGDSEQKYKLAYMTKCSDSVLRIKKCTKKIEDCMIDPNGYSMMGFMKNNERGNHNITCRTILNQILIQNKEICEYLSNGFIYPIDVLHGLGFLRAVSIDDYEIIMGLEGLMTEQQKEVINLKKVSYSGEAFENEKELVQEYLNIVNKNNDVEKKR